MTAGRTFSETRATLLSGRTISLEWRALPGIRNFPATVSSGQRSIFFEQADLMMISIDAPAITIPQPAYNPTLAEPVCTESAPTASLVTFPLFQLPPPPAYIQKPEASQEEVSRQDTRVPSTEATSGLPGYDHATNRR